MRELGKTFTISRYDSSEWAALSLSPLFFSFSFLLRMAFIAWLTEEAIPNQVLTYQLHQ